MRAKHASNGWKYGDTNKDHVEAVKRVISFWNKFGINIWRPITDLNIRFNDQFVKRHKLKDSTREYFGHYSDIAFILERYDHEGGYYKQEIKLIIEVDGERHSSKQVQINDGIFEQYIQETYNDTVKVIRLRKEEVLGQTSDVEIYLKKELKGFLK